MKALIISLLISGWYLYGWKQYALWYAWKETEKDIERWPASYSTKEEIERERRENLVEGYMAGTVWPFAYWGITLIDRNIKKIPKSTKELKLWEQELVERERQLGIQLPPLPED